MSPNLAAALGYIIARQQAIYDLECREKGNVRAADPDQNLQFMQERKDYSRIPHFKTKQQDIAQM
jgi:hypothetical protein